MKMFRFFLSAAKDIKNHIVLLVLTLFAYNGCLIIFPFFLNQILFSENDNRCFWLMGLGFCALAIPILSFAEERLLYQTATRLAIHSEANLLERLSHKRYDKLSHYSADYIVRVVNNFSNTYSNFYLYFGLDACFTLFTVLVMLLLIGIHSLILLGFVVLVNIGKIILIYLFQKKIEKRAKEQTQSMNLFLQIFKAYWYKAPIILVRQKLTECLNSLRHLQKDVLSKTRRLGFVNNASDSLNTSSQWIIQLLVLLFGLFLLPQSLIEPEDLQMTFFYSQQIGESMMIVSQLVTFYGMIKSNFTLLNDLLEIEDTKKHGLRRPFQTLDISDLSFHYPNQENLLSHLNMTLSTGHVYVLRGENGSGKSTFTKLLAGLYPASKGTIHLDESDLGQYDMTYYQSHLIAVLAQSDLLLDTTVADNLFAKSQKEIDTMVKLLQLPDSQKAIIQGGKNLSGGEKRRILLARVLLQIQRNHPSLIILDEPFYALDQNTINIISQKIEEISRHSIVIIVSHESRDLISNEIDIHLQAFKSTD